MNLDHKNFILTGASSGIGFALLKELMKIDGAKIITCDIASLPIKAPNVTHIQADLTTNEGNDKLINFASERGSIDVFIANAGFAYYEKDLQDSWERIEKIFTLNATSPIYSLQRITTLNQSKPFTVVFISSAMAKFPMPGYALYSASKSALEGFTRSYFWTKPTNTRLISVYPIATRTKFFSSAGNQPPVPWPTQSPEEVAREVKNALISGRNLVFTSKIFAWIYRLNRIFPIVLPIYAAFERFRLLKWSQIHQKRS